MCARVSSRDVLKHTVLTLSLLLPIAPLGCREVLQADDMQPVNAGCISRERGDNDDPLCEEDEILMRNRIRMPAGSHHCEGAKFRLVNSLPNPLLYDFRLSSGCNQSLL